MTHHIDVRQGSQQPKRLDSVRSTMRTTHDRFRTEAVDMRSSSRCMLFHHKRQPKDMGAEDVGQLLSDLAVTHPGAASIQDHALSALLVLSQVVLRQEMGWLDEVEWATKPRKLPVVWTQEEAEAVLKILVGHPMVDGKGVVRLWPPADGVHPLPDEGGGLGLSSPRGQGWSGG